MFLYLPDHVHVDTGVRLFRMLHISIARNLILLNFKDDNLNISQ